MSYQVLANKWRPQNFSEMVGQQHVLRALTNALNNGRVHHAFLFTGTRGVGKTTVARILAKALNCEQGISAKPCGECNACLAINQGKFVDLIEVDAASRTKVEDTRELLDNVQYSPTQGRFKIYLIDEVHMLSTHSFNALLKTLEEPPGHVKFLLATTDPQKLPVTILSRCLQFNLKPLSLDAIRGQLDTILDRENIREKSAEAVTAIARAADGSMRDALSLLDQALAYCNQALIESDVHEMLGSVRQDILSQLMASLSAANASEMCLLIQSLAQTSPNFDLLLTDLTSLLHRIALAQFAPEAVDDWFEDKQTLLALAQKNREEDIQLYYQIALQGRRDLPLAPDPKTGFEMLMLRMLAFKPVDRGVFTDSRAPQLNSDQPPVNPNPVNPNPVNPNPVNPNPVNPNPVNPNLANQSPANQSSVNQNLANPNPTDKTQKTQIQAKRIEEHQISSQSYQTQPAQSSPSPSAQNQPASVSHEPGALEPGQHSSYWASLIQAMNLTGPTKQLANFCALTELNDRKIMLALEPKYQQICSSMSKKRLEDSLNQVLGQSLKLEIKFCTPDQETPVQLKQRAQQERLEEAVESIKQDSTVQELQNIFDATISPEYIQPIETKEE